MSLANLVTSQELSIKLKEAGVPQKSVFWWIGANKWNEEDRCRCQDDIEKGIGDSLCEACCNLKKFSYIIGDGHTKELAIAHQKTKGFQYEICSAYLAGELGIYLPDFINTGLENFKLYFTVQRAGRLWEVGYACGLTTLADGVKVANTEAEARGEMLLWLIEKGYVKMGSEINSPLEEEIFIMLESMQAEGKGIAEFAKAIVELLKRRNNEKERM